MESVLKVAVAKRISEMTKEQVVKVLLFMADLEKADAEYCFEKKGCDPKVRIR